MMPIDIPAEAMAAALHGDSCDHALARLRYDILTSADWVSRSFALLQNLPVHGSAAASRFLQAISSGLGTLLPQDGAGTLVREVKYRGLALGEGASGRYSDSRQGGNLHTDGPHRAATPPAWFSLLCVRQSRAGGDLVLVDAAHAIRELPGDVVALLKGPFLFDQREPGAPPIERPILAKGHAGTWHVNYLREYVNLGHRHPQGRPLSRRQREALDAFDRVINKLAASSKTRTIVKLAPGQMILVNNQRLLHGRTTFGDDPRDQDRLMLRTWIRPLRDQPTMEHAAKQNLAVEAATTRR